MILGGLSHDIVAVTLPGGRDEERTLHAHSIHLDEKVVGCERCGTVRVVCTAWNPGPLRAVRGPHMHLCVDDHKRSSPGLII
jgi:hypothetical protein